MNQIKNVKDHWKYQKSRRLETWVQLKQPSKECKKSSKEEEEDGEFDLWVLKAIMHKRLGEKERNWRYEMVEIGNPNWNRAKKERENLGVLKEEEEEKEDEWKMKGKGKVFIVRDKWETDSHTMNGSLTHAMYLAFNMESGVSFSILFFSFFPLSCFFLYFLFCFFICFFYLIF